LSALLEVEDLRVTHDDKAIVDGVSFTVERGEALALAGESGCGKTTTALSLLRLLPPSLTQSGKITLRPPGIEEPINIGRRTETGMRYVRWRHISLVFQGAMNSLDPVQRIDKQLGEAIRIHASPSSEEVRERIDELLETVGLTPALGARYPHQLSGGQRQRVMIALALVCRPSLVIADEPTTALDVVMQAQVLQLLERLRERLGLALILISHDLGVLAETCDRIAVMYAGRIVELGRVGEVYADPQHPLYEAPARLAAGDRGPSRTRGADPGLAARPRRAAARLPLPPALPLLGGALRGG
jgi:peptide/nickel transport system ATP-binding protein